MAVPHAARAPADWGHGAPHVYLDANILLPQYLRSVFLDLAAAGLIRVHWGAKVLAEVRRNLRRSHFGLTPKAAADLVRLMSDVFPTALVRGGERLESLFGDRVDAKDAHVAAGALRLRQHAPPDQHVFLVTRNIRHLPQAAFVGMGIRSVTPGVFLRDLLAQQPEVSQVMARMIGRFRSPSVSQQDLLLILERSGCSLFARALASVWGLEPR